MYTENDQIVLYKQEHNDAEDLKGLWKDVFHRLFPITRSTNAYERLGATAAIGLFTLTSHLER